MDSFIVVAIGIAGLLGAAVLLVVLRGTARPKRAEPMGTSTWQRTAAQFPRGAGSLVGSIIAGILVMGLGGRLMMRVIAATSDERAQGTITDMDAVVGEVTFGGSLGLILFVGTGAGVIAWIGRLVLRRWMPDRSLVAGLLAAGIGGGLFARNSSLLEPSSIDFAILSPTWLAVLMILFLLVTFGMLSVVLADYCSPRWPPASTPMGRLALAPLALLIVIPPLAVALLVGTVARARLDRAGSATSPLARFDPIGHTLVLLGAIVGAAWVLAAAVEILRG